MLHAQRTETHRYIANLPESTNPATQGRQRPVSSGRITAHKLCFPVVAGTVVAGTTGNTHTYTTRAMVRMSLQSSRTADETSLHSCLNHNQVYAQTHHRPMVVHSEPPPSSRRLPLAIVNVWPAESPHATAIYSHGDTLERSRTVGS